MSFFRRITGRISSVLYRILGRKQPGELPHPARSTLADETPTLAYPGAPLSIGRAAVGMAAREGTVAASAAADAASVATTAPFDFPVGHFEPSTSPLVARPVPRPPTDAGPDEASTDPRRPAHARTTDKHQPPRHDPLAEMDVQLQHGAPAGLWLNPGATELATALSTSDVAVQRAVDLLVRDRMVVFDVGACFGLSALVAARRCTEGRVVAFEPLPDYVALLERSASRNVLHHVQVERCALGDREGEARLHLSRRPGRSRLDVAGIPPEPADFLTVSLRTLDRVVATNVAPPPDLLVVDVEGAEAAVLRGAAHVLRAARPLVVVSLHGTGAAIARLLDTFGMDAYALGAGDAVPPGPGHRWAVAFPREREHLRTYVGPLSHRAISEPDRVR